MAISPARPQTTMAEVAAAMRANPQDWSVGVSALGSAGHLSSIEFVRQVGADVTFVPYRGTTPLLVDLMGGRLGINADPMLAMLPPVRSGNLRGIALTAPRRNPAAPEIPTTAEAGFHERGLPFLVVRLGAAAHAGRHRRPDRGRGGGHHR